MIDLDIRFRYEGIFHAIRMSPGALNQMLVAAWKKVGIHFHEKFRPKHFTKEGAREYGYQKRAGEAGGLGQRFWKYYTGIKQKTKHHTLPLVWAGEAGGALSLSRSANVDARIGGVKLNYTGLQKLHLKNPKSPIDMVKEFTTISDAENRELEEVWIKEFERQANAYKNYGIVLANMN